MTADEHDDPLHDSVEHLQTAAREVIAATRSLLDAAEELLDDPAAVQGLVASLGAVATAAARRLRGDAAARDEHDRGDGESGIQHIRVS